MEEDYSFSLIVQSSAIRGPWANFCKYDQGEDSIYNSRKSQRTSDSEGYNELSCLCQAIASFFKEDAAKEEIGKKLKECDLQVSCGTSMGETDGEGGDDCSFFSHKSYFGGCSKDIRSYKIPEGVTEIPHNAFYGCSTLTSITIPERVRKIEGGCFP
ncbi:MAG: leucine-rich repeat domain-containing protein [Ruminococcus sp.]|nr:leucine-rich repeat domain-containing protein [Ruminococcus sp.]